MAHVTRKNRGRPRVLDVTTRSILSERESRVFRERSRVTASAVTPETKPQRRSITAVWRSYPRADSTAAPLPERMASRPGRSPADSAAARTAPSPSVNFTAAVRAGSPGISSGFDERKASISSKRGASRSP